MRPEGEPDNHSPQRQKPWLITFIVTLFTLAIFWSVDRSIVYILLGIGAFSIFKMLQLRPMRQQTRSGTPFEKTYQPSFWDQLKFRFANQAQSQSRSRVPRQSAKVVRAILIGFSVLIFLSIIIPIIFSDDSDYLAAEAEQKASSFYDTQQYDSAAFYYRIAIVNNPDQPDLYFKRGNSFLNANKHDSAVIQYDRAITLQPAYKEAYYNKGWILFNSKQYNTALQEGRKALAIDPNYADGLLLNGDCFYNMNRSDSAIVLYERAYQNGYRSAALSNMMAYIYDVRGNAQKAIPYYQEAVSYDSTLTDVYRRLGELIPGEDGNGYRQKAIQITSN